MCILHNDLRFKWRKRRRAQELTAANRGARFVCARQLLQRFSEWDISFIFFTDDKIFNVNAPSNPQIYRDYVVYSMSNEQVAVARRLKIWCTFSQSLMVSVGISKLGYTDNLRWPGHKSKRQILFERYSEKICRQRCAICHRICSYFNRTMLPHTGHVRPSHYCRPPLLTSLDQKCSRLIHQSSIKCIIQYGASLNKACMRHVSKTLINFSNVWWLSKQLEKHVIDSAIDQWRRRLRACVHAKGQLFEHSLWINIAENSQNHYCCYTIKHCDDWLQNLSFRTEFDVSCWLKILPGSV